MNGNSLPSERCAIVASIDPDVYTAAAYSSGCVSVSSFRRLMAVIQAGDLGTSATLDAKLQRCSSAAGANAEDIAGAVIVQMTQAGTDSNKQSIINYDLQKEKGNAKTFIRVTMTVGTATSDASALLFGFDPFYAPASDSDADSVEAIPAA